VRLEVRRPGFVYPEDHLRLAGLGEDLAVGDGIQVLDAGFLDRIVGSVEVFRFSAVER
jgi:hypothetical protein